MRKFLVVIIFTMLIIGGCGTSKLEISVEQAPESIPDVASEFIINIMEGTESLDGLNVVGTLEMAKMDHGVIEVVFDDVGDGRYKGTVELPMGGEWIAAIAIDRDGKITEDIMTFDVKER